jgi:hypothetical protein
VHCELPDLPVAGDQVIGLCADGGGQDQVVFGMSGNARDVLADYAYLSHCANQAQRTINLIGCHHGSKVWLVEGSGEYVQDEFGRNQPVDPRETRAQQCIRHSTRES